MKLSISIIDQASEKVPVVLRGNFIVSVNTAKEIGYDGIELFTANPKSADTYACMMYCRKEGIEISSIATGLAYIREGLSLTSINADIRNKAVERVCDFLDAAGEFGAIVTMGQIKGKSLADEKIGQFTARLEESLKRCVEYAEMKNVKFTFEAINRYESEVFNKAGEAMEFIRKFKSGNIRLHIDTFHMNIEEADMLRTITECRDLLEHVHFADNDRMYPGHGCISFDKVVDALKGIGFDKYIAFECLSLPKPVEAARMAFRNIKTLLI